MSHFDVAIIGGGPAGLAAAQVLGRQRRNVVLIDNSQQRNATSSRVHMLLGREGMSPAALVLAGRLELEKLPSVAVFSNQTARVLVESKFFVSTTTGQKCTADYLILATGVVDQLPAIRGVDKAYGSFLFHCPLCDGFEFGNQQLVVIGGCEQAAFMAAYICDRVSKDVQLCSNGKPSFSDSTRMRLERDKIQVIENKVISVQTKQELLTLVFEDFSVRHFRAGFLPGKCCQRSSIAQDLGCKMREDGRVGVDQFYRSSAPNVFAVGDMAKEMPASGKMTFVSNAIASGVTAGAFLDEHIFSRSWIDQELF